MTLSYGVWDFSTIKASLNASIINPEKIIEQAIAVATKAYLISFDLFPVEKTYNAARKSIGNKTLALVPDIINAVKVSSVTKYFESLNFLNRRITNKGDVLKKIL